MAGTSLTGLCSVLLGKLGVGKVEVKQAAVRMFLYLRVRQFSVFRQGSWQVMLRFPSPVTSGFLGTIGFFLVRTALQISSGALDSSQELLLSLQGRRLIIAIAMG